MTEFERIKKMDVVDLAMYIFELQSQAIEEYEKGFFPKSTFDNVAMLVGEALKKPSLEEQVAAAQAKINPRLINELQKDGVVRE